MNQEQALIDIRGAYDLLAEKLPHWGSCAHIDYDEATCPNEEAGCNGCVHDKENKLEGELTE